ncbi:MAG: cobalt-zinc-cadmium efflux system membrane fusion protein, partial [Myxococcota bacterium]
MIDETRVVPAPLFVAARAILSVSILGAALWSSACAGSPVQDSTSPKHGVMSERTAASDARLCEHGVPGDVCVRCHAHLTDEFKATGDWCPGHDVPESQCFACHPGLSFEPLPTLRSDADWEVIAKDGADVASLEAHVATGKV